MTDPVYSYVDHAGHVQHVFLEDLPHRERLRELSPYGVLNGALAPSSQGPVEHSDAGALGVDRSVAPGSSRAGGLKVAPGASPKENK